MLILIIYTVVMPLVCVGLIGGFIRLIIGPTLPDRIVAFELIATSSAGIIVVTSIAIRQPAFLDVASVWAIISFLSVIAFAHYIERWRGRP